VLRVTAIAFRTTFTNLWPLAFFFFFSLLFCPRSSAQNGDTAIIAASDSGHHSVVSLLYKAGATYARPKMAQRQAKDIAARPAAAASQQAGGVKRKGPVHGGNPKNQGDLYDAAASQQPTRVFG
jgi:hypothetical protein